MPGRAEGETGGGLLGVPAVAGTDGARPVGAGPGDADAALLALLEHDESYRVASVLSEGPLGRTERVWRDGAGPFVRKRIPAELANPAAWRAAAGVRCPRVPRVLDLYELPDELVVVCEHVEGETLAARVSEAGRLAPDAAAPVARDVCEAASALHAAGVVHRDVTPGNVVLAADGAHLVDLGIARLHDDGVRRDTTSLGTWGFAAPEQFGFAQTDARSDVYSIGRLLGFMLTGLRPDAAAYDDALGDAALVPPRLAAVVRMASAFEPGARFASAAALARTIAEATGGRPRAPEGAATPASGAAPTQAAVPAPRPPAAGPLPAAAPAAPERPARAGMRLLPAAPSEMAAAWRSAGRRDRNRAAGSLAAGTALLVLWLLVAGYGVTQVATAPSSSGVASLGVCMGLAATCLGAVGLEPAAAALGAGAYRALPPREARALRSRRRWCWAGFLLALFAVLVFGGASFELALGSGR